MGDLTLGFAGGSAGVACAGQPGYIRTSVPGAAVMSWRSATNQRQFAGPFDTGRGRAAPACNGRARESSVRLPWLHWPLRLRRSRLRKSTQGSTLPS